MAQGSLGSLVVSLAADIAQFQSDLGKAVHIAQAQALAIQRALDGARNVLVGLGAAVSVGAIVNSYKQIVDAAEEVRKSAEKFGTTTESFSALAYAGKATGVSMEDLNASMSKLSARMADAAGGGKQSEAVFKAMGISVQTAGGQLKNTDEILREIAQKFDSYRDGAGKAALATELFGKGGAALIPMLNNLRALEEEAKRIGVIFGGDMAKASADLNDNITRLNATFTASKIVILNDVLPWLNKMLEQMTAGIQIAGGFANALKLFGLSTITSENAGQKIREIGDEIVRLQKLQANPPRGAGSEMTRRLANDIATQKKLLEYAKFLQRQSALDLLPPGGVRDENAKFVQKGQAPTVSKVDSDAIARARQKQLDGLAKLELDALKDLGQQRSTLLDQLHGENLISERDYWAAKVNIAKDATDAELKVLNDQLTRQQGFLAQQKQGSKEYYDALGNVQETQAKINKTTADFQQVQFTSFYGAIKGTEQYKRSIEEVNVQLLELKGSLAEAARRRQELSDKSLVDKARSEGDAGALAAIEERKQLLGYQADFNQSREEQSRITARLQIEEDRIQNSLRTGAISELEAMRKTGIARANAVEQLEAVVRNQEIIAELSKNPALQIQAEQSRAALERLRSETDLLGQKIRTVFEDSFASALTDFIMKTKTASEAFKSFANSVIRELVNMQAKALATDIFGAIFPDAKGGGGGGAGAAGGGLGLFDFVRRILGGGGMGDTTPVDFSGEVLDFGNEFIPLDLFGGFATGTDYVPRTGPYLLHEGEAVVPAGENRGGPVFQVDMRGASVEAVARLEALVQRVNGSIEPRAIAAVVDHRRRGK